MTDRMESMETILRDRIESAREGHLGKIALAQSRILFGGIGEVADEDLQSSTKMRQIGGIVDKHLLNKIPDWEIGVTSHAVAQFLMNEFGEEILGKWYEVNVKHPLTQDTKVVEVKTAIAEALANKNEKTT